MEEIDHYGAQEPHQDVQDREKDESFNSIGHEDYFLRVSLGIRIIILISIGEKNHS
jgi:hypothetical protein